MNPGLQSWNVDLLIQYLSQFWKSRECMHNYSAGHTDEGGVDVQVVRVLDLWPLEKKSFVLPSTLFILFSKELPEFLLTIFIVIWEKELITHIEGIIFFTISSHQGKPSINKPE